MKLLNVAPSVIISGRSAWMWQLVVIYYSNPWLWKFHESWVLWMLITCYCYPQKTIRGETLSKSKWAMVPTPTHIRLVVLTILKNISQWEGLSHILWNIKNVWNHQPNTLNSPIWGGFLWPHKWFHPIQRDAALAKKPLQRDPWPRHGSPRPRSIGFIGKSRSFCNKKKTDVSDI